MEFNQEQFKQLLDSGEIDSAISMIEAIITAPSTETERNELSFTQTMTYIKAKTELNNAQAKLLNDALLELKKIDEMEMGNERDQALEDIRNKISGI